VNAGNWETLSVPNILVNRVMMGLVVVMSQEIMLLLPRNVPNKNDNDVGNTDGSGHVGLINEEDGGASFARLREAGLI